MSKLDLRVVDGLSHPQLFQPLSVEDKGIFQVFGDPFSENRFDGLCAAFFDDSPSLAARPLFR